MARWREASLTTYSESEKLETVGKFTENCTTCNDSYCQLFYLLQRQLQRNVVPLLKVRIADYLCKGQAMQSKYFFCLI